MPRKNALAGNMQLRMTWAVAKVYADEAISGKSAKTMHRHQYQQMLRDAQRRAFDVILIHQYDRIARSLGEHVNLEIKLPGVGHQAGSCGAGFRQRQRG